MAKKRRQLKKWVKSLSPEMWRFSEGDGFWHCRTYRQVVEEVRCYREIEQDFRDEERERFNMAFPPGSY